MLNQKWKKTADIVFERGIAFMGLVTILLMGFDSPLSVSSRLAIWLGIGLLTAMFVFVTRRENVGAVEKIYRVGLLDSVKIVENVLNAKQIPFEVSGKGNYRYFRLPKDGVEIRLGKYTIGRRVLFRPSSLATHMKMQGAGERDLMVRRLRERLDEGFAPRGL